MDNQCEGANNELKQSLPPKRKDRLSVIASLLSFLPVIIYVLTIALSFILDPFIVLFVFFGFWSMPLYIASIIIAIIALCKRKGPFGSNGEFLSIAAIVWSSFCLAILLWVFIRP